MSNILYRIQVASPQEEDVCVIDSNDLLEDCINEQKKKAEKIRRDKARKQKESEPQLDEEGNPIPVEESEDDFVSLEEAVEELPPEEEEVDYVALAREEADQILAQAQAQADMMLEEAETKAEAMKFHAEQDGHKDGYDHGYNEALQLKVQWEQETESLRAELQAEYEERTRQIEHELIDTVCEVVEKVFLVQFGDKKELIRHAIDNVLSNVEGSKEFLIRVNEKNAEYLRSKKEELQQKVGQEVVLDVVQDPLLDDSQCMIETDGGLFDCSMDTQMRNLIKDIRSLA